MINEIVKAESACYENETGEVYGIVIYVNIYDLKNADEFISKIADKFNVVRTISHPETSSLLISLIGLYTAKRFKCEWNKLRKTDKVLNAYMSLMEVADVIHGTPKGEILEHISLIYDKKFG